MPPIVPRSWLEACGSSALAFAMHQGQVACVARHEHSAAGKALLRMISQGELLVASSTTERATGGDTAVSSCAVEKDGDRFRLRKNAPVISYGEQADIILVTARRGPAADSSDQVLVACTKDDVTLVPSGTWDTVGFRGTCSLGYELEASGPLEHVLQTPFAHMNAQTMLPFSHVLWASVWLGLSEEALDLARAHVQAAARTAPGELPMGAMRLADATTRFLAFRAQARQATIDLDVPPTDDGTVPMARTITGNCLKMSAASHAVAVIEEARIICGLRGYRRDGGLALERLVRDAQGASVMISDDRLRTAVATMLLVAKSV